MKNKEEIKPIIPMIKINFILKNESKGKANNVPNAEPNKLQKYIFPEFFWCSEKE